VHVPATRPPVTSAILFDLDGVLVDSSRAIAESINRALLDAGRPAAAQSVIRELIGMPLHDIFEWLGCGSGAALHEYVAAYRAEYERVALSQTTVVAGVPEVLGDLSRRHRLAVATTKPLEFARPILAGLGLDRFFAAIFGPSLAARSESKLITLSRAIEALKPLESLALVGDRTFDVCAARHANITAVGALWGYGTRDELMEAGAQVVVGEPAELLRVDFSGPAHAIDAEIPEDGLRDV
jgi:phosphoglycolate phosphatase